MIHDMQISQIDLKAKHTKINNFSDKMKPFDFIRINSENKRNPSIMAQMFNAVLEDGSEAAILRVIYQRDKDVFTLYLYAITMLLYRSIMYFRRLPIKKRLCFNKLLDENKFLSEVKNSEILLSALSDYKNGEKYLLSLELDPNDSECKALKELADEYIADGFELNEQRKNLIFEIEKEILNIKNAYKNRKYKVIQRIGYDIHNLPEMIRTMIVY